MDRDRSDVYINGELDDSPDKRGVVDANDSSSEGEGSSSLSTSKNLKRTGIILGCLGILFGVAGIVTAVVLAFDQGNRSSIYYNNQDATVNRTVNNETVIRNIRELNNGDFALKTEVAPLSGMITATNTELTALTTNLQDNYYNRGDVYTKTESDARFFTSAGGQVTGPISTTVSTFQNNEFVNKQYVDDAVFGALLRDGSVTATGILSYESALVFTDDRSIVDKGYVDTKLSLNGGTVTGAIKGIAPVDNADLTTKQYVDERTRTSSYTFSIDNAVLDAQTNPSTLSTAPTSTPTVAPFTSDYIEENGETVIYDLNQLQDRVASFKLIATIRNYATPNPATQLSPAETFTNETLEFIKQADGSFAITVNGAQVSSWSVTTLNVQRQYSLTGGGGGFQATLYQAINNIQNTISVSNGRIILTRNFITAFARTIAQVPTLISAGSGAGALLTYNDWDNSSVTGAVSFAADSLELSLLQASSESSINIPDPAANASTRSNLPTDLVATNFNPVENGLINLPEGYLTTIKVNTNFRSSLTSGSLAIVEMVGTDNAGVEKVLSSRTVATSDLSNEELAFTIEGTFLRTTDANISPYSTITLRYKTYGGDVNLESADVSILYKKV